MTGVEGLRRRYRPERIRVLLVGESPPASGRHFYAANSGLYRVIRETLLASELLADADDVREFFRDNGWLLVDLSQRPVNRLHNASRRAAHKAGIQPLARTIRSSRPEAILVVVAAIRPHVRKAIQLAPWSGSYHEVPYPGRWVQARRNFTKQFGGFARLWLSGVRPSDTKQRSPRQTASATRRWRRSARTKRVQAAVSATKGLRWSHTLLDALLEELYVDSQIEGILGRRLEDLRRGHYAQAVAVALLRMQRPVSRCHGVSISERSDDPASARRHM